jgi:HK97 family phage major capsid protein
MRKAIRDAILREVKAARAIADAAVKESRELSEEELGKVNTHMAKAQELEKSGQAEDGALAEISRMTGELGLGGGEGEGGDGPQPPKPTGGTKRRSVGQNFIESTEFKALLGTAPSGKFSEKMRVQSAPFEAKELFTATDDTSAGVFIEPQSLGLLDPWYQRPLSLRQLVTNGRTTTDTIEYVRMVTTTNRAAVVPEATTHAPIGSGDPAVTAAAGGLKPESGFTFDRESTTVKTLAHWIPVTKRALADAAQIRTMIDSFLRYGLEEALEDEILAGNGTGEHFLGLENISGIQVQAAPGAGEDVFDVTRRARRKVQIGGRARPTAYVMNPIDWEEIELRRDGEARFYGAGPFAMTPPRLWGLPVVESEVVDPGTAWVADWSWAILWDREQASIQVTDSHADFFVRNLVALLAESRHAFGVLRPAAFCRIDLGV